MTADKTMPAIGWRVLGLGVIALGALGLYLADFIPGQPVPKFVPFRTELAYAVAAFMTLCGLALQWRRATVWAAAALSVWYWVFVVLLMDGRMIARNLTTYLAYGNTAEQVAIAAAALIVYAERANLDPALSRRLIRFAQLSFGVCAVLFGGAHFFYMNLTAPLVPAWLPPSQLFWGYATGVFHILGGLAILSGVQARLGAILLTVMYALFTPLVHLPLFFAHPTDLQVLAENATNLVLTGAAWVVADSLGRRAQDA